MTKTGHPAPWRRRHLGAAGLALAGLLGAVSVTAATAQASQSAHPAATTGAIATRTIHLIVQFGVVSPGHDRPHFAVGLRLRPVRLLLLERRGVR